MNAKLKEQAIAAIDALHADENARSREKVYDALADLSNHIDDLMRKMNAARERAEMRREMAT